MRLEEKKMDKGWIFKNLKEFLISKIKHDTKNNKMFK
jgi:hypothetical protein